MTLLDEHRTNFYWSYWDKQIPLPVAPPTGFAEFAISA